MGSELVSVYPMDDFGNPCRLQAYLLGDLLGLATTGLLPDKKR